MNGLPAKKKWSPTKNPKSSIVPGKMRSDCEEIPTGFTKSDADKAEMMEATLATPKAGMTALTTAGCQVYWPSPYEVCGAIKDKYNQLGGPNSFLLFPKSNELTNPGNTGKRSEFVGGHIYWSSATGARPVAHDFLTEWGNMGYEGGILKYPTTDEIVLAQGRKQEFQGGVIYWSALSGAHTIHGSIRAKYDQLGGAESSLKYPLANEEPAPAWLQSKGDRVQYFQGGTLIWKASTNTVSSGNWLDYASSVLPPDLPDSTGPEVPVMQSSCPPGTQNNSDPIYNCVTVYEDAAGNHNIVRSGRRHDAAGKGGFGQLHYTADHSVEPRAVELLLQDSMPQPASTWEDGSAKGTRKRYAKVFTINGEQLIAFQVISNWQAYGGDSAQFGVLTAYCSDPKNGDAIIQHCPDIMPPFNLKPGE